MSDSPVFFRDAKTIESLNRILERFVVSANAYIKNNFQGHPEAHVNPYLLTEYVSDMAVAAQLYAKINGGKSLYAVATKRGDGTAQPAVPQLRRTIGARGMMVKLIFLPPLNTIDQSFKDRRQRELLVVC